MVEQVRKRDGRTEPFDRSKIETAIRQAFAAAETEPDTGIDTLTDGVITKLEPADGAVAVEEVQDHVERSARLVRARAPEFAFRTTFDPGVVGAADVARLADLTGDGPLYVRSVDREKPLAPGAVDRRPRRR